MILIINLNLIFLASRSTRTQPENIRCKIFPYVAFVVLFRVGYRSGSEDTQKQNSFIENDTDANGSGSAIQEKSTFDRGSRTLYININEGEATNNKGRMRHRSAGERQPQIIRLMLQSS